MFDRIRVDMAIGVCVLSKRLHEHVHIASWAQQWSGSISTSRRTREIRVVDMLADQKRQLHYAGETCSNENVS